MRTSQVNNSCAGPENGLLVPEELSGWRIRSTAGSALDDCCLVIPTYRRPREIHQLVDHLASLPDGPAEVVVVDGSPTDDECGQLLRQWAANRELTFDLIYVKSRPGTARQRNAGIDISTREFIYFLDDDCLPEPGYFSSLRQVFANDTHGRVGAVRGLFSNDINQPVPLRCKMNLWLRLVARGEPGIYQPCGTSLPGNLIDLPFTGTRPVDVLPGGASAFRRAVLEKNRFSDFFQRNYVGEDLELSLRIRKSWQIRWCGDARLLHNHSREGRPTSFKRGTMEVVNRYFIWKRNSSDVQPVDRLRFWLGIAFAAILDLAAYCRRPWTFYHLSHVVGVAWGVLHCLLRPPRYEEPQARSQYVLRQSADQGGSTWQPRCERDHIHWAWP